MSCCLAFRQSACESSQFLPKEYRYKEKILRFHEPEVFSCLGKTDIFLWAFVWYPVFRSMEAETAERDRKRRRLMKNQYVGDVGDYGKYGLLRWLADHGIRLAVNWYLTPDDSSNDGKHISYLEHDSDKIHDRELYDALKTLIREGKRDVAEVEKLKLIKDAVYYHEVLDLTRKETREEKRRRRSDWHQAALEACRGSGLVFLDPDNGLRTEESAYMKNSGKYVYAGEAADYYRRGQQVVYYCQKGRRTPKQWEEAKNVMAEYVPDAILYGLTFHRGTQRTYLFVLHREEYKRYSEILNGFLGTPWGRVFSREPVTVQ